MTAKYIPTDEHKAIIKRMAGKALNLTAIGAAIGVDPTTLRNNPEARAIYTKEYNGIVEDIAESALNRARSGDSEDNALRIFFLKTRARWRDQSYIDAPNFRGTYEQKKTEIDDLLSNGFLSIEDYQKLSSSITDQYKNEEHEVRLRAVEELLGIRDENVQLSKNKS